jgi:hypothetical protein
LSLILLLHKKGRITALDAAGPFFEAIGIVQARLDKTDALFVDAIHTTSYIGYTEPIGHVDVILLKF